METKNITFYISSNEKKPQDGIKLIAEHLNDIIQVAYKYSSHSRDKVYIDTTTEKGIMKLTDYIKMIKEDKLKNSSLFWSFLKKVHSDVKKSGDNNTIKDTFNALSFQDKVEVQKLYYALSNKLSNILWDNASDYEEKHPEFYLSEDGMMDLIPYLMTLGEERVTRFFSKPQLALTISQKDWEYPFNLCSVFLYFKPEENNQI